MRYAEMQMRNPKVLTKHEAIRIDSGTGTKLSNLPQVEQTDHFKPTHKMRIRLFSKQHEPIIPVQFFGTYECVK